MYRVIARLITVGFVADAEPHGIAVATSRVGQEVLRAHRGGTHRARDGGQPIEARRRHGREATRRRPEPLMKSVLAWLVRLFPAGFRERFGADMIEHVERDYDCARARGPTLARFGSSSPRAGISRAQESPNA